MVGVEVMYKAVMRCNIHDTIVAGDGADIITFAAARTILISVFAQRCAKLLWEVLTTYGPVRVRSLHSFDTSDFMYSSPPWFRRKTKVCCEIPVRTCVYVSLL